MGASFFVMENYKEAIKCFEKSIKRNNFYLNSWYNLLISYVNIEDEEHSKKVLRDISKLFDIKDYACNSKEYELFSNIEKIKEIQSKK
jgi:tetratricopeptide (TPR) repeat protein